MNADAAVCPKMREPAKAGPVPAAQPWVARATHIASLLCTRILSLIALCSVAGVLLFAVVTIYDAAQDSFIAPAILSPSSDVVLASKLKLGEIEVERARSTAELDGVRAELNAIEKAFVRLAGLRRTAAASMRWTTRVTSARVSSGASQLGVLRQQETKIEQMIAKQRALTEKAHADAAANVISHADYAREAQTLSQLELALLENRRAMAQMRSSLDETSLAQQALERRSGAPPMPELVARQEQMVRVELEMSRLEAEERAKRAQKTALEDRVAKLKGIAAELRSRPAYRAIERSLDVGFVPYTQIEGVKAGARVLSCVWGLFWCEEVGRVADLLPGEVVLNDPWGTPARGQYVVLNLRDREAAKAKTLRVRPAGASRAPAAPRAGTAVSTRGT